MCSKSIALDNYNYNTCIYVPTLETSMALIGMEKPRALKFIDHPVMNKYSYHIQHGIHMHATSLKNWISSTSTI